MKKLFFFILLFLSVQVLMSATLEAQHNGDWSDPLTWLPQQVPGCGDIVIIPELITITVDGQIDFPGCSTAMGILIYGKLYFKSGKLHLPVGSGVYLGPGATLDSKTGGLSSRIDIGNVAVWYGGLGLTTGPIVYGTNFTPLPVELLSFEATCNGNINIRWSTATETNNDHFTLEKSTDARNWDFVADLLGAGNSNVITNYQYTDEKSLGGISYYRLKQTDRDGKYEIFSPVAVICSSAETDDIIMYPNPFKEDLIIQYSKLNETNAQVNVYDMRGNIVMNGAIEVAIGSNYYILDLSKMSEGIYYVEFISGNTISHQKVLKN